MIGPFNDQVIIEVQPTWTEVRGVKTADWSKPVRFQREGWDVQPAKGGRDFEYGSGVTRIRNLYGPYDTPVGAESRYELPGESGQFTVLDGPNRHDDTERGLGLPGPRHTKLVIGIKEG